MKNNLRQIYKTAIESVFKPPPENEILLEVPKHKHINRLNFGKGSLAMVHEDGRKMVYYKAEKVIFGLIKTGIVSVAKVNKDIGKVKQNEKQ